MISFLNKLIITFIIIIISVGQVFSHSVQVQYCVSCSGDLRIWLEHWHGNSDPNSTTMTISVTVNGTTSTITSVPGGAVTGMTSGSLPGCSTPITYAAGCPSEENTYNDWVYYDFPGLPANIPLSFTIISGNTVFTEDCCSPCMYPLIVNFTVPSGVTNVDDQNICYGNMTNPVIFNNNATWTNSNPSIGLPASGSGTIPSFSPSGLSGTTALINFVSSCGSGTFDYIIQTTSNIDDQDICVENMTDPIIFDNNATWTNSNPSIGLPASGSGTIPSFSTTGLAGTTALINYNSFCATGSFNYTIAPTILTSSLISDYNGNNVSCFGADDGSVDMNISGGFPPFTYNWNNGEVSEDLNNLIASSYSVIITDINGCKAFDTIVLTEPIPLQASIQSSNNFNGFDVSCFNFADGAINLNVSGSVPPYTYLWNTLDTSTSLINIGAGNYHVDIVHNNGCIDSLDISLSEPTPFQTTIILSDINGYNICNDGQDGFIDLTVSGSVPLYSYVWNNGDTTEDLGNLGAGSYYYTVTDQNGCITTDTIEITEPILNIQESVTDVSCFGGINGSVLVSVSGSTAPYYIFWDNNINTSLLSAGTYSYQIIDSIGCSYNDSLIVSDPDSFVVIENITNVSCYGFNDGEIVLDVTGATPPYIVDWFGFSTINMSAGTYNFTILDSNNCAYSEIAIVSEPNQIGVLNQVVDPSCGNTNDGSVSLLISGGTPVYYVDWGVNNPNSLAIGTYEFVIIDDNNCLDSNSVTLIAESNIQVIADVTEISCNSFCDGAIDLQINGGVAPYIVDWFGLNSAALCEGLVSYNLIDAVGCSYSESFLMVPPDSVELIINQIGMQLEANASGGISPYSYEWFNDLGSLINNQNVNITSNGNYYCIAIDANHCQSDTITYFYSETSINDSEISHFNIYPNPTADFLNIEFESINEQNYSIYLVDLLGQKILLDRINKYKGNYTYKLDLIKFEQGIYILEVESENKIYNNKIIIK